MRIFLISVSCHFEVGELYSFSYSLLPLQHYNVLLISHLYLAPKCSVRYMLGFVT
jgi:hypothetical protein